MALSADVKPSQKGEQKNKAKRVRKEESLANQILQEHDRKQERKKKKKRRKSEAAGACTEHAVLADTPELLSGRKEASGDLQGHQTHNVSNKEEAEGIRACLGISAADPNSARKRKSFQFSFSLPEPTVLAPADEAAGEKHENVVVSDDAAQIPAADPQQAGTDANSAEMHEELPASFVQVEALPGPPARNVKDFVPRRVYVGGMPFWYTEDQIRACWGECGEIESLTMLKFPDSGNFRGIVFITYVTQEAYEAALAFSGDELEGKYLVVKPCRAAGGTTTTHASRQEKPSSGSSIATTVTAGRHAWPAPGKKGAGKSPSTGVQSLLQSSRPPAMLQVRIKM